MTYFATSDLHFGHKNAINYCNRPYEDLEDMEACLIKQWNAVVQPTDTVFVLGDFAFCSKTKAQEILSELKGFKHFIWGNHDRGREKAYMEVPGVEGDDFLRYKHNGQTILMTHYPFESFREDFHFHGHTHGQSTPKYNRIDVGVDSVGYRPYTLDQLIEIVKQWNKNHNLTYNAY
jgi:calcineurin-like phosphoesterase family protein